MSEKSNVCAAGTATLDATQPRDFHPAPAPRPAAGDIVPLPWIALTKADCVLWAIALHRAAVAARLSNGADR